MSVWPPGEIFFCEGTFERLFLGAIFGTNAPHFIAGWRADFKDQVSNRNNLCGGGINRRLVIIICKADFSLTLLVPFTLILYFFLPRTRIAERWSIIWSMRLDVSYRFPWSWMNGNRCSRCGSCPSDRSFSNSDWLMERSSSSSPNTPCDQFYRHFSFIDVPIESCGKASPLRVALQASAPDILLILLR